MKHYIITLILLTLLISCNKEDIKPNIPTTKKDLRIVMLGDSETKRINHYWGPDTNWNTLTGYDSIFNFGFSAYKSNQIIGDHNFSPLNQALDKHPDVIFLMIGINDAHHSVPLDTTIKNITTIINYCISSGVDIVIQSVIPTTNYYDTLYGGFPENGILAKRSKLMNDALINLCFEMEVPFLDVRPGMTEVKDEIEYLRNDLSIDGIHINYDAYTIWKDHLKKFINQQYKI